MRETKILLGPFNDNPAEVVGAINRIFYSELKSQFTIIPHYTNRSRGLTSQGNMNVMNAFYGMVHTAVWVRNLVFHKPHIAHYAITSHWNMEKSLLLLGLAQAMGLKTVGHLHGGEFRVFWSRLSNIRRRFALFVLRRLDVLVVLSEQWKKAVMEDLCLPSSKVEIINNPLGEQFESVALKMPVTRTGKTVLCMGVMDSKKGLFEILEAARILGREESVTFHLVGPDREPLATAKAKEFIKTHHLEETVKILGPIFGEQKAELFKNASVFLSASHFENFPVSVFEAAASALPIVTTPVGSVPEFFQDGVNALFVEVNQPRQIASVLKELLQNPAKQKSLALAARDMYQARMSRQNVIQNLSDTYVKLASI